MGYNSPCAGTMGIILSWGCPVDVFAFKRGCMGVGRGEGGLCAGDGAWVPCMMVSPSLCYGMGDVMIVWMEDCWSWFYLVFLFGVYFFIEDHLLFLSITTYLMFDV